MKRELERIRKQRAEKDAAAKRGPLRSDQTAPFIDAEAAAAAAAASEKASRTLKVSWLRSTEKIGRLPEYDESMLQSILSAHGEVEDIIMRPEKKKKRSALIVMKTAKAAQAAANSVNGDPKNPLLVIPLVQHKDFDMYSIRSSSADEDSERLNSSQSVPIKASSSLPPRPTQPAFAAGAHAFRGRNRASDISSKIGIEKMTSFRSSGAATDQQQKYKSFRGNLGFETGIQNLNVDSTIPMTTETSMNSSDAFGSISNDGLKKRAREQARLKAIEEALKEQEAEEAEGYK